MNENVIEVRDLGKRYRIATNRVSGYTTLRESLMSFVRHPLKAIRSDRGTEFWALKNVSLDIRAGETVGVIGRNGAGKSTFLKVLSRITEPTSGHALIHGRVGSLLEVGTGFHPELSGRENILLNGAILGMRRTETERAMDEIVAFAEVGHMLDTPVKHYSSGMYMRLAFAVAAHLEPEIMLVDEVLAVGDVAFQRKCLGKMDSVARAGRTVLFVSHNMQAVRQLCQRAVWMRDGGVVADGPSGEVVDAYLRDAPASGGFAEISAEIEKMPEDPVFRLRELSILQDGEPTRDVLNGLPTQIRVAYDSRGPTPGLHITLQVCDSEGAMIFESIHNGNDPELPVVPRGHHVSTATIPADFLAAKTYELRVTAGIANVRAVMPPVTIRIQVTASGQVNRAYPGYLTQGKIAPLIPWTTESQDLTS